MLDCVLQFKGEAKRIINKIVKYNLYLLAHKGIGFDSYVVSNNLPQWRTFKLVKNGLDIVSLKIFNGYVDQNKKIPQYVHLRCGLLHIKDSLKNIGKSYKLQPCLLKQELEHDEFFEDNWEEKENEWLPYLKNDVLSTTFSYARYSKRMEELTGFGIKNSLTLPALANKYFNILRDESDEPIYTYNDELTRHFVRQSIKGGRCSALNQYYKSNFSQEVFSIISKELNVNGNDNVCEIINKYFDYKIEQRKILEDKYDSQLNDYRHNDEEARTEHISRELNRLAIHKKLQKINVNDVMMDFDATSLYLTAMWDENSVYSKIETGFAFKPHMNKTYVDAFNNQTFNQDGDESVILRIKYYNPRNLIIQHLPVKEKVKNVEVNRMRNGFIIDTLTSVDICEIVKTGARVVQIYEGVIYRENFKITPFRKVIEKLLALRQKYKDEHNDLMQRLGKLFMNSLYGIQIGGDIDQPYKCKSHDWMETEYDENVLVYWKLPNGNYVVKLKKDDGLEEDNDIKNTLPSQLGAFILSNSKRIMNNFIRENNGFYSNSIYYGEMDGLYIEKKYWDALDKANLVGKYLCQGKNDYKTGGIFYRLFLAPKIKYVSTIDNFGIIQQHMTFKRFNESKRLLDRSQYFDMLDGKKYQLCYQDRGKNHLIAALLYQQK